MLHASLMAARQILEVSLSSFHARAPLTESEALKTLTLKPLRFSGTKLQPKLEVFGRISLRTSGQKLRSGPPNPGKTSISERTSRRTSMKKLRSEKLRADFPFPGFWRKKESKGNPEKKRRVFLFAESLESLEKKGKP